MAARAWDPTRAEVEVVPMRRRHLRAVLRIESAVYPRPWSLGLFITELAQRSSRIYRVAKAGGSVVGYGGLMLTGGEGHVTTLAVDESWRRQGVATRLLAALAKEAVATGVTGLSLEVRMGNPAAQALYRKFGFVPAGVRKNYYAETNEDAMVMWAHDVATPGYAERLSAIAREVRGAGVERRE
jgi:ribosomal-protein-alanine N-acetyltransferase